MAQPPAPPARRGLPLPALTVCGLLLAATLRCTGGEPAETAAPSAEDALRELTALPYLSAYSPASGEAGVTAWSEEQAWNGYNLFHSGHAPEAYLMEMDGTIVHSWARDFSSVWNEPADEVERTYWRRVWPYPDGKLLVLFSGEGLALLDRDSEVVWAQRGNFHHDMVVDPQGRIHALLRAPGRHDGRRVLEDFVQILEPDGEPLGHFSILRAFALSEFAPLLEHVPPHKADIFHTNTVQLLDGSQADRFPHFAEGNYLVSLCYLSTIAVLDPRSGKIVWALHGEDSPLGFRGQHDPLLLDDGRMLLFDNLGQEGFSRVVEFDATTQQVTWEYAPDDFASFRLGANQRLPNGNTLITDSVGGRAFEVTPGGEIAWSFANPHSGGDSEQFLRLFLEAAESEGSIWGPEFARELERQLPEPGVPLTATILEMTRLPPAFPRWL